LCFYHRPKGRGFTNKEDKRGKQKHIENLIKSLPESERAAFVEKYLKDEND